MDTLAEIYKRHSGHGKFNDKNTTHSYLPVYEEILRPYRETSERVIELGVLDGHSWAMWREYFPYADVCGVDCDEQPLGGAYNLQPMIEKSRGAIWIFDATDAAAVAERCLGRNLFSVIIEDCSHQIEQQVQLFQVWKEYLNRGAIYIVEDIADVDRDRVVFEELGFEIIDRRNVKQRFDDVLAIWRKPA